MISSKANIITQIMTHRRMSKYAIAKHVGVSWAAVQLWSRGVFKPKAENMKKLLQLFKKGG